MHLYNNIIFNMAKLKDDEEICPEKPVVKKRGRKPNYLKNGLVNISKEKNIKIDDKIDSTSNDDSVNTQSINRQVDLDTNAVDKHMILHLSIKNEENKINDFDLKNDSMYENTFFEYDPTIKEPIAYDMIDDKFSSYPQLVNNKNAIDCSKKQQRTIKDMFDISEHTPIGNESIDTENDDETKENEQQEKNTLNKNTIQKSNKKISDDAKKHNILSNLMINDTWANLTNYHCYWDCHPFDSVPYGIPVKYKNDKFYVTGCFCSLECAVSYNFESNDNLGDAWERYNLINLLPNKLNYNKHVNPALSRKCLKIFGGDMDINTFRNNIEKKLLADVLHYPMVLLVEQIDEVTNSQDKHTKHYIPLDKSRIEKIVEAKKEKINNKQQSILEKSMMLKMV